MDKRPKGSEPVEQVRREAEARLAIHALGLPGRLTPEELLHELDVHRVELEMQNEELRRAQVELAETRDRYHELYDFAPVAYVTLDRTSRIIEANLAAGELLRCDRSRLVGSRLSTYLTPAAADEFHRFREVVFESGIRRTCELSMVVVGRPIQVHLDALVSNGAQPTTCRCVLVDVSELRAAQEQARSQTARIQTMFDTAPNAIIGFDDDGLIETFSGAAERLFGYRFDEVRGQHVQMLIPSITESTADDARRVTGQCKDGTVRTLLLAVGEWRDRGKRKHTAILHDETEHDAAERRQHESDERFRQIAETIDDVFYIREREGGITYASPAYERLRGESLTALYTRGELGCEAIHGDDRERMKSKVDELINGTPYDEEFRILRIDGTARWVRDRAFPVHDHRDRLLRTIGVMHDVTVERDLELALRQAQKMEAVGALASGVAHDINNVLQVVFGVAELAEAGALPPERLQVQMRRIKAAAQRGADLVHRLMAFARKQPIIPRALAIDPVVVDTVRLVERLVTENVRIELRLHAQGCFVLADVVQIEQILLNIASNARDAMPGGGGLTIETAELAADSDEIRRSNLQPAPSYVRITVRDTGVGMDEATSARIFEPFFTTKDVGKGTGLGLATVYAVTRELGGEIAVDSAIGAGTAFVVIIPCCERPAKVAEHSAIAPIQLQGTALLVDDDPSVRVTMRGFLECVGLDVIEAATADEALARTGEVDVVVTDVVMPTMTGPKLVEKMRQQRPDLRALFVSAHPADYLIDSGMLAADAWFLQKPFSKDDLGARLSELLDARV